MAFYSQNRKEVLELPLKTFWLMSNNIDRIDAQEDMRSLTIVTVGQSGEAANELRKSLNVESGMIVKVQEVHERDEAGFEELRGLQTL
jgi:hypothetical protein